METPKNDVIKALTHNIFETPANNIVETSTNNKLRRICQGFCGSVWAPPSGSGFAINSVGKDDNSSLILSSCAVKREEGGPGRSLYNDFIMHQQASKTPSAAKTTVHVPKCHEYITFDDRT